MTFSFEMAEQKKEAGYDGNISSFIADPDLKHPLQRKSRFGCF